MKILFTGGGTGGHLMPTIAISRELKRLYKKNDLKLHYVGPRNDFEIVKKEGFTAHSIAAGKIRRYFSLQNIVDILFKIPFSFLQSFFLILFIRPKLVFSKGGTGSLPVTYCAKLFRIPVFIHESDTVPGLSNKITSEWAKKVFVSFENTEHFNPKKATLVGNPIRKELLGEDKKSARPRQGYGGQAKEIFNLTSNRPVILFWGGSQGAKAINEFVLSILNQLLSQYEVIHITGVIDYQRVKLESQAVLKSDLKTYYHLHQFLPELELKRALGAADVVVSRAGSGSIFEIAALGKPSILVPLLSSAGNHQSKNAYQYAKNGAAIVIEQTNLSPNFFIGEIGNVLSQSQKMKNSALKFAKPNAAELIAKEIINYLGL